MRFLDPIPVAANHDKIEDAAIRLSRKLLNRTWGNHTQRDELNRADFAELYVDLLIRGLSRTHQDLP